MGLNVDGFTSVFFYYMTSFFLETSGIVRNPDVKLRIIKPKEECIRGSQNLDDTEVTIGIRETIK